MLISYIDFYFPIVQDEHESQKPGFNQGSWSLLVYLRNHELSSLTSLMIDKASERSVMTTPTHPHAIFLLHD